MYKRQALLAAFIAQYYLRDETTSSQLIPKEVIISPSLPAKKTLAEALGAACGRKVRLTGNVRGHRAKWRDLAAANAVQALSSHINNRQTLYQRFERLQSDLDLEALPKRIECFDISHTQGEKAVASCVVFDQQGARKTDYRHFNVAPAHAGDDYEALEEAVRRRYQRVIKEQGRLPDLLLIDGGKGQMQRAWDVAQELGLQDRVRVMGIGKGPSRRPGFEVLYLPDGQELVPGPSHSALHLLQQVRDCLLYTSPSPRD